MSMLSDQCDRLRLLAESMEDERYRDETAHALREAADTIWDLREQLLDSRGANELLDGVNDKLRAELRDERLARVEAQLERDRFEDAAKRWMGKAEETRRYVPERAVHCPGCANSYIVTYCGEPRRVCKFVLGFRPDDGFCDRGERRA